MEYVIIGLILILLICVVGIGLFAFRRLSQGSSSQKETEQISEQLRASQLELQEASVNLAGERAAKALLEEQLEYFKTELQKERDLRQKEVQEAQKERDLAKDTENKVLLKLAPVAENIDKMQQKIVTLEEQRQKQHISLEEMLRAQKDSEKELRDITGRLAGTLTKGQSRGSWGEMQLKRILEYVGLLDRIDFDTQVTGETETARVRPDCVLNLPGGKSIPIDSKAPFDSYFAAGAIPDTADEQQLARRAQLLADHSRALRLHISALADKKYWESLGCSPDFVVLFVPSESLLSAALETDPGVLDFAFEKRVALASPVTLWSILKSVAYAWNQEEKISEVNDILEIAKQLYKNVGVVASHSAALAKNLDKTVDSYNKFASSLERNFITTGRKLDKLDLALEVADLPQIEKQSREFTKEELLEGIVAENDEAKSLINPGTTLELNLETDLKSAVEA